MVKAEKYESVDWIMSMKDKEMRLVSIRRRDGMVITDKVSDISDLVWADEYVLLGVLAEKALNNFDTVTMPDGRLYVALTPRVVAKA